MTAAVSCPFGGDCPAHPGVASLLAGRACKPDRRASPGHGAAECPARHADVRSHGRCRDANHGIAGCSGDTHGRGNCGRDDGPK